MPHQSSLFELLDGHDSIKTDQELFDELQKEIASDSEIQRRLAAFQGEYQQKAQDILRTQIDFSDLRNGMQKRVIDGMKSKLHQLIQKQFEDSLVSLRDMVERNNRANRNTVDRQIDPHNDPIALIVIFECVQILKRMLRFETVQQPNLGEIISKFVEYRRLEKPNSSNKHKEFSVEFGELDSTDQFIDICRVLGINLYHPKLRDYMRLSIPMPTAVDNKARLVTILKEYDISSQYFLES